MSEKRSRDYDYTSSSDVLTRKPTRSFSMKGQKPPDVKLRSVLSKAIGHFDRATDDVARAKSIKEIWEVVETSWQLPVIGRDLAYDISDTLKRERIVAFIVGSLQLESATPALQRECARLLSQILTTDNRHYVAKIALEVVTKYTKLRGDIDIVRINVSILESLFKDSEATCTRLIELGALDTVVHACRHDDLWTARHCSAALANAAIYGGSINHRTMVNKGAPDWLFPLAFRTDDFCRYYACLAVTVLAANPLVETAVVNSGTLDLVEPFVQSHDPYEFAQSNPSHAQGRSASFLQRMIPLLISGRPEAQALASFYFAMEASIKAKQQKTQIFSEISAIIPLKRVIATSRSSIARVLAGRCLKIIGEDVPRKLSPQIHLWDMEDVQSWLTVAGFRAFHQSFRGSTVDGEMLLLLTERELKEDLDMTNNVHRKRFIRDLNRLRAGADYRSVDTSNICDWLRQIDSKFAQYTYRFLQAGVDRGFLPLLTDTHLKDDCSIGNGVHRTRILSAVQSLASSPTMDDLGNASSHKHDVFISYRRKNGSHLASLLKVHLQVRGYRVFLDVDSLQEGDFADRTLKSVKAVSAGFILILTAGALDKCAIDHEGTDWLHKEILTAISNRRNIVPVTTETFQWPLPEDLPQDIAPICFYNGVKWVHEYQDACVEKIDRFLKGQVPPTSSSKLSRMGSVQSGRSALGMSQKRRSTHPNNAVRPSGSSTNLLTTERVPRPRQRASPPGQASSLLGATVPSTSRDVTAGAQSEGTRSLDQGDGASAPFDQGTTTQFPVPAKSPVSKTQNLSPEPSTKKKVVSPSAASTTSTSSSKNLSSKGISKEIVRLDDVIAGDRSRESGSYSSSDYSSGEESGGWEVDPEPNEREQRGGADGKSKQDVKPTQLVKPPPANVQTVTAQVERGRNSEMIQERELPDTEARKPASNQSSPERKPKPSNKYKAPSPPPPTYEAVKAADKEPNAATPEPKPRPEITSRPKSAEPPRKMVPVNGGRNSTKNGVKSPKPAKSTPNVAVEAASMPGPSSVPKSKSQSVIKNDSPNMIKKPPRAALGKGTPKATSINGNKSAPESHSNQEIPFADDISDSDYSYESHSHSDGRSNSPRTHADGDDGGPSPSLSRTSSSAPSDLGQATPKAELKKRAATTPNGNSNNSNNVKVNGVNDMENTPQPRNQRPNKEANSYPDQKPRQDTPSRASSTRSTPASRSSHSLISIDTHSPPRSPTKVAPPGASKPAARRDILPTQTQSYPKRSASERLQMTRPPHPNYPTGHYHPPGSQPGYQNPPGYDMKHYKAAMSSPPSAPYQGYPHPHHGHSPGHQQGKGRPGPPTHGFDTAV